MIYRYVQSTYARVRHLSFRGKPHSDEVREHGPLSARLRWRRRALRHERVPVVVFVSGNAVVAAGLL